MEYGERKLFEIPEMRIYTEDKIGIIGQNGAGKTTLMEIIMGNIVPQEGSIDKRADAVYIPQLGDGTGDEISDISKREWNVPDNPKSGGEITRRKIAEAFSHSSQILLCDEPTSNLDEEGIAELEKALQAYNGTVLLISHDRALLDAVCTSIWEIDDGRVNEYHGNYTDYKIQKELERKNAWDEYDKYIAEKKHLQSAVTDRSSRAQSMKNPPKRMGNSEARLHRQSIRESKKKVEQASTQIKRRLERLEAKDKPKEEISFKMTAMADDSYVSRMAVSVKNLSFSYGTNEVLGGVSLNVSRGDKIAVCGINGSGKSTLLGCIASECAGVNIANGAKVGYFRQDLKNLDENLTLLECVKRKSVMPEHMVRTVLGRLGIRRNEVHKKVEVLSGGERCKAILAQLICGRYPILILDEPTNYLDIYVMEALEDMLSEFDGTVILVSHDRYFRKKIAQKQLVIENGKLRDEKKPAPAKKNDTHTMLLEMEKADLISRMSYPKKGDTIEALEERYNEVCGMLGAIGK